MDSTAVVRLLADTSRTTPAGKAWRMEPVPFPADLFQRERYVRSATWRIQGTDSVRISWFNGLGGPIFQMSVRGDSLVGQWLMTSDYRGGEPGKWAPARAVRTGCE